MTILHLISSPRKQASFSIRLGNGLVQKLLAAHPGSTVHVHDLTDTPFPHVEEVHLQSFFTPAENRTPDQQRAVRHSDEAIAELMAADYIVIGAPLYNFGISSTLKAWLDHISRAGITFRYSAQGAEGLVQGKKVYLAVSSGAIYSEGPWASYDFVVPYLRTMLGFLGMTDVTVVRAEGTYLTDRQDAAVEEGLTSVVI